MASFINASSTGTGGLLYGGDASGNLQLQTDGSTVLTVTSGGLIGIGTTNPSYKLDISGTLNSSGLITSAVGLYAVGNMTVNKAPATSYNLAGGIKFQVDGTTYAAISQPVAQELAFYTGSDTSEKVRIDNNGYVGIGTNDPQVPLDLGQVNGWIRGNGMYLDDHDGSLGKQFRIYNYGENFAVSRHAASAGAGSYEAELFRIDQNGGVYMNSGYGTASTAYGVRAWIKHTGGVTVQASGGISSVTYHGVGDYTYNFNFTMPDANYSTVAQGSGEVSTYHTVPHLYYIRNTYSTTACSIGWFNVTNSGGRTNHTVGCVIWVR